MARGLVAEDHWTITFRHDLTRQALEQVMTPWRRRELYARVLAALADDDDVVRRATTRSPPMTPTPSSTARRAAAWCSALGAHREAAALLGSVIRHADRLSAEERAELFEAPAVSCAYVDQIDEALAAADVVLEHRAAQQIDPGVVAEGAATAPAAS